MSLRSEKRWAQPGVERALERHRQLAAREGILTRVLSKRRTRGEQFKLYRKNPRSAMRPGTSQHEYGLAYDLKPARLSDVARLAALAKAVGMRWGGVAHPFHFQVVSQSRWAELLRRAGRQVGGFEVAGESFLGRSRRALLTGYAPKPRLRFTRAAPLPETFGPSEPTAPPGYEPGAGGADVGSGGDTFLTGVEGRPGFEGAPTEI